MNPLVREWVDKAEGDYLTALREVDVCQIQAQQPVKKMQKKLAIFRQASGRFPKRSNDTTSWTDLRVFGP